jgi:iron complex transport system substrate-binding protein
MSSSKNKQILKYVSVLLIVIVVISGGAFALDLFAPASEPNPTTSPTQTPNTTAQPTTTPSSSSTPSPTTTGTSPSPTATAEPENVNITVTDMVGRTVTLPKNVKTVVTTVPDTLRLVVMLGAVDKVVGITSYISMGYAPKMEDVLAFPQLLNVSQVGASSTVDAEKIAEIQPDVVFLYAPYSNLVESIEQTAHVPVVCISAGSQGSQATDDFYTALRLAGTILGKEAKAEEIIAYYNAQISNMQSRIASIPLNERKTLYLANWANRQGTGWTTSDYWPVIVAGGINLAQNLSSSYMEVDKEQILNWNPDVIFIHASKTKTAVTDILNDPLLKGTTAVKDGAVYGLFGPYIGSDPKMWLVDMYITAKTLYPTQFSDIDVVAKAHEIFQYFYGSSGAQVFDEVIVNRAVYISDNLTP